MIEFDLHHIGLDWMEERREGARGQGSKRPHAPGSWSYTTAARKKAGHCTQVRASSAYDARVCISTKRGWAASS